MKRSIILAVILILLTTGISPCIQSKPSFESIALAPELEERLDENTTHVLFLFGIICVGGCPIGNYIQKIKNQEDVVYILPLRSTESDISNFRRGLQVKGKILLANQKNVEFVESLSQIMEVEDGRQNFILVLKNKKVVNVIIH